MRFPLLLILCLYPTLAAAEATSLGAETLNNCWKNKKISHVEIVECQHDVKESLQKELDALVQQKIAEAHEDDQEMIGAGAISNGILEDSVKASQASFEKYMADECQRRVASYWGGTFGADAEISCNIDLIKMRMRELEK